MPRDRRLLAWGVLAAVLACWPSFGRSQTGLDAPADLPPVAVARIGTAGLWHAGGRSPMILGDDGTVLSVASAHNASISLGWWDVPRGRPIRSIDADDVPPLRSPRLFDRQRRLAGLRQSHTLVVVDLQAGKVVLSKDLPVVGRAQDLAVSPDGNTVAVPGHQNTVLVSTRSGEVLRMWKGLTGASVGFRPDGKAIAVATGQWSRKTHRGAILLMDVETGEQLARSPSDWDRMYTAVRFADDGRHAVAWARIRDPDVHVFDAETFRHVRTFTPKTPRRAVALGGRSLAVATDAAIHVWDLATGRRLARLRAEAGVGEGGMAIRGDGRTLATLDRHGCVDLRRVATDESLAPPWIVPKTITALAVEDGAEVVWTGDSGGRVVRWEAGPDGYRMNNGRDALAHRFDGPVGKLSPAPALDGLVAFAPGERVLIGMTEACRVTAMPGFGRAGSWEAALAGVLTRGGRRLLRMDVRGAVRALDLRSGEVSVLLAGAEEAADDESSASIHSASFSADEQWAAIDRRGSTELVHLSTGERALLEVPRRASASRFGPMCDVVVSACGGRDGVTLRVWELDSLGPVGGVAVEADASSGTGPVFLGPGRVVAGGDHAGRVRLMALAGVRRAGRVMGQFPRADEEASRRGTVSMSALGPRLTAMAASPDGRRLVTAATDTTALVWDVAKYLDPPSPPAVAGASLEELWAMLGQAEASKGYPAVVEMAGREGSAAFLAERLKPITSASDREVAVLISQLDSSEYRRRREAFEKLQELGPGVSAPLRKALADGRVGAESRARIEAMLRSLQTVAGGASLRGRRAVRVLERIGGAAARAAIAKVAEGEAKALLTRAAVAALGRMAVRRGE